MSVAFTAHNIKLDDGTFTKADAPPLVETPWFIAAKRVLNTVFPDDKSRYRIADLGCLEGGFATEFARMGFQSVGLEVRKENFEACQYIKTRTNLPNLSFVKDDAWNIAKHGNFDAIFCCGLLYHLDQPKKFLQLLSSITRKLLIVQTHFSTARRNEKFSLSEIESNEGLKGRWYTEYASEDAFKNREAAKWGSWDNHRSFWVSREHLLQAIQDVGFDLVLEQYDSLGSKIADSMTNGYYHTDDRGTFVGIKTMTQ